MNTNIGSLIETIENDEKLIAYMKQMYKEKTGEDIVIQDLKSLAERQLKKQEEKESIPNQKFQTFKDKVIALNLPDINDREARFRLDKLRRLKDTKVLFKKLDISHFANKGLTIELLYKVLDGLKVLRSVEEINLSHNDLGDEFIDVISDYLMLKGLYRVDLSFNKLTKASVKKLVATLKGCKRFQKVDVSYNPFNLDERSCSSICSALKDCDKIEHFGINDASRESAIRFVSSHPTVKSLNLEDSRYKKKAWDFLGRIIGNNKRYEINNLSLKFCKIDFLFATPPLVRAFKKNNSLIKLNLYNTGLDDFSGTQIINALNKHKSLEELNLGANFLAGHFCKAFGKVLTINNTLRIVNITKNHNISKDDYYFIIEGLTSNQSIISLGDLIDMKIGVKYRESTEKLLLLNQGFSDWKNVEGVKFKKANLYTSNVYSEHIKQEKQKENELFNQINLKLNNTQTDFSNKNFIYTDNNNNNLVSQTMTNNFYNSNNSINFTNNSINSYPNFSQSPNKNNKSGSIDKKEQRRIINERVKESLTGVPNSNFIDKLTEKLPEGNINQFFKESVKNENSYTNDVNKIIQNIENTQNLNDFQSSDLNKLNFNKQGKYIVPYSMTNTHYLQELQKYAEEMGNGKRKKTFKANSRSKSANRRGKAKVKPSLINIIASITQELINTDKDLKEAINNFHDNIVSSEIGQNRYDKYDKGEGLSYGRINLEEMDINTEDTDNIISKYNLIENNFDTGFHEQEPFYL